MISNIKFWNIAQNLTWNNELSRGENRNVGSSRLELCTCSFLYSGKDIRL